MEAFQRTHSGVRALRQEDGRKRNRLAKGWLARPTSLASTREAFKEFEVRVDVIVLVLETHSGWKLENNAE